MELKQEKVSLCFLMAIGVPATPAQMLGTLTARLSFTPVSLGGGGGRGDTSWLHGGTVCTIFL